MAAMAARARLVRVLTPLGVARSQWIQPILVKGFKRELEATDLPKMDPSRQAAHLADLFEGHFARRRDEVIEWNRRLDSGEYVPSAFEKLRFRTWHRVTGWGHPDGKRDIGIAMALSGEYRSRAWWRACSGTTTDTRSRSQTLSRGSFGPPESSRSSQI